VGDRRGHRSQPDARPGSALQTGLEASAGASVHNLEEGYAAGLLKHQRSAVPLTERATYPDTVPVPRGDRSAGRTLVLSRAARRNGRVYLCRTRHARLVRAQGTFQDPHLPTALASVRTEVAVWVAWKVQASGAVLLHGRLAAPFMFYSGSTRADLGEQTAKHLRDVRSRRGRPAILRSTLSRDDAAQDRQPGLVHR